MSSAMSACRTARTQAPIQHVLTTCLYPRCDSCLLCVQASVCSHGQAASPGCIPSCPACAQGRSKCADQLLLQHYIRSSAGCGLVQDFGESWKNLTEQSKGAVASFWDFDWGARMHQHGKTPYNEKTILATAYEDPKHMKGIGVGWDEQIHFIQSDDFFASAHNRLASCGNQFEIAAHKVSTCASIRKWCNLSPPEQHAVLVQSSSQRRRQNLLERLHAHAGL